MPQATRRPTLVPMTRCNCLVHTARSELHPNADVPVVMLSLKSGYDVGEHMGVGQALAPLRDEGILILGSGLTYHNMRGFGRDESTSVAEAFESYLTRPLPSPTHAYETTC